MRTTTTTTKSSAESVQRRRELLDSWLDHVVAALPSVDALVRRRAYEAAEAAGRLVKEMDASDYNTGPVTGPVRLELERVIRLAEDVRQDVGNLLRDLRSAARPAGL